MVQGVVKATRFCPALKEMPRCENMTCPDCGRLRKLRRENDELAERMSDYWANLQGGNE